jgi:hypothetical protein
LPPLPPVSARLPYALELPSNFLLPQWTPGEAEEGMAFEDPKKGMRFEAGKLVSSLSSSYGPGGARYPFLSTDGAKPGDTAGLLFEVETAERYDVDLYFLKGPAAGNVQASIAMRGGPARMDGPIFAGYAKEREIGVLTLEGILLKRGANAIGLEVTGKDAASAGFEAAFVGMSLVPAERKFITGWNLIGPFDAPDMNSLTIAFPPESETQLDKSYPGKAGRIASWKAVQGGPSGYINLLDFVEPNENVIAYALKYVEAPADVETTLLLGSDDGVRVWINDALVHTNAAYRASAPDLDRIPVRLKKGPNKILVKVLQGAGAWGFHLRFADPDGKPRWRREALFPGSR